ncbi:MAG: sensor histidine kinase [Planctomycetota bacterium]
MTVQDLSRLAVLVRNEREALLARWRERVRELPSARHLDAPTLNDHLPALLDELADALESGSDATIAEALRDGSSPEHGSQRVVDGYDIEEVVAEYNILRGCIHDLAEASNVRLQGPPFRILNRVLDGAIAVAVATFATRRALEIQQRREEYLAFVAHDLRTPLNAIAMSARVLELKHPPSGDAETARMIKALRRNAYQLEELVAKVLDENRNVTTETGVKLERRSFDLWPLVEALVHDLHPVAGKSSTTLVNEVPDDFVVYADASLVRRIFQNLIANAITYTPRGEVRIAARVSADDGATLCTVSDNGAGIPAALLESVFEKGEGDPERAGSSGLGLAIVKTFVDAHAGRVSVASVEGRGTTITFTLPARR